ncbi:MAG TPA: hypothetical protein VIK72_05700 [Clostridiaceae bacterium]
MKKIRANLLGIYDLILAFGAIFIGIKMINSSSGIFTEYPKEWLSKIPFDSWVIPGIMTILLFGLGNIIAASLSFRKRANNSWFMSATMGGILFISLIIQIIILGETYLATIEFLIFSIIQLYLSGYGFISYRKRQNI